MLRKSKANSEPIAFLATDANARLPSCFRMPKSDDRVMFKYLRDRHNSLKLLPNNTLSPLTYLDNSHGFCVHPMAVKSVSRSDAEVVSKYCLCANFHSGRPPSRKATQYTMSFRLGLIL